MRKGVKFHDGKALTAADVVYTFLRYTGRTDDQTTPINEAITKLIDGVSATDEHTVSIKLKEPSAAFISICVAPIIPEGSGPTQADMPIGTGPYKFKSYSPGIGLAMTRFDDYYGRKPEFAEAEFKIFTNANAGHLALQNGEIHIMKLESATPAYDADRLKLIKQPQNMVQLLAFNHEFKPFSDIRVRRALNYAIDKEMIIEMLSPGSLQLDTNISPVMRYFYNESLFNYYPHDPNKAAQLLSEAGYGEGELSFTVKVPAEYQFHVDTAQIIKQQFAEAGVNMEIEIIEWNSWLSEVYEKRNHQATIVGLAGKADPGDILVRQTSDYYRNFGNYSNPQYDALILAAASVGDLGNRAKLYKEAEDVLADDAAHIYIMDPANNILTDRHIEGYATYPIPYIDLRLISYNPAAGQ
jgi:peptide/nickel transport system substrate-binding protein